MSILRTPFITKLRHRLLRQPLSDEEILAEQGLSQPERPYEGKMVFSLKAGELTNVIHFLTLADRTGELELSFSSGGANGYLYFRDGEIYCAILGSASGIEAVARIIKRGQCQAYFTEDLATGDTNINVPVSSLLVQAVILADELKDDRPDSAVTADDKPGTAISPQLPPAARTPLIGGRGQRETIDRRMGARDEAATRYNSGIARLLRVIIGILVFAFAYALTYAVHQNVLERLRQRREAAENLGITAQRARETAAQQARIERLGQLAAEACEKKEFEEAFKLAAVILEIDAAHPLGPSLRETIGQTAAKDALPSLQTAAEESLKQLRQLTLDTENQARRAALEERWLATATVVAAEDYAAAATEYRQIQADTTHLILDVEQRQKLAVIKQHLQEVRRRAIEVDAAVHSPTLWRSAEGLETAGENELKQGNYSNATITLQAAIGQYREALDGADAQRLVERRSQSFKTLLAEIEHESLDQFGGEPWLQAQALATAAREDVANKDYHAAAAKWEKANAQLKVAVSQMRTATAEKTFREATAALAKAMDEKLWNQAIAAAQRALAVPGHQDDQQILAQLNSAKYEQALSEAQQAQTADDWPKVLMATQTALTLLPESTPAQALAEEARKQLIPRLQITTRIADQKITGAQLNIPELAFTGTTPVEIELELNKSYDITIALAPRNGIYYHPFHVQYTVKHPGPQELTALLLPVGPPLPESEYAVPGLDLALMPVPPGSFMMGDENGRNDEKPAQAVTISRHFWIGKHEITNAQYRQFIAETRYDGRTDATGAYLQHLTAAKSRLAEDNRPVCFVSWSNAVAFSAWLTTRERRLQRLPEGYAYRLPTEAEWEYSCRTGGPPDNLAAERQLNRYGWHSQNSGEETQAVGTRLPNRWGIHDMHGNVWELCRDWYGPYTPDTKLDPAGPERGVFRVMRGGSWQNGPELCRATYRGSIARNEPRSNVGFRIVLAPEVTR